MIIKKLSEITNTDRDVDWGNGKSRRFLIKSDKKPFTITETTVNAGTESKMQYPNHVEACYCIEGTGEVETAKGIDKLEPGVLYVPENDKHILRATTDLKLVCVFSPPLQGSEHHTLSEDGYSSYESDKTK